MLGDLLTNQPLIDLWAAPKGTKTSANCRLEKLLPAAFWSSRVGRARGTKVINYAFREGIEGIQRWKMKGKRGNKKFSLPPFSPRKTMSHL